jgi:hypothetical protein
MTAAYAAHGSARAAAAALRAEGWRVSHETVANAVRGTPAARERVLPSDDAVVAAVTRHGSARAAARALGVSHSYVGRVLARLADDDVADVAAPPAAPRVVTTVHRVAHLQHLLDAATAAGVRGDMAGVARAVTQARLQVQAMTAGTPLHGVRQ